jgi:hypothetical protein
MSGDPDDEGGEQQRRDDRLDQPQEDQGEQPRRLAHGGPVVPDLGPQRHRHQDPGRERPLAPGVQDEADEPHPAAE